MCGELEILEALEQACPEQKLTWGPFRTGLLDMLEGRDGSTPMLLPVAMHYGAMSGQCSMLEHFLALGAPVEHDALFGAASYARLETLRWLLDHGAVPQAADEYSQGGRRSLLRSVVCANASEESKLACVALLLERCADKFSPSDYRAAFVAACHFKAYGAARAMVNRVDPHAPPARSTSGATYSDTTPSALPLVVATLHQLDDCVDVLLGRSDVNARAHLYLDFDLECLWLSPSSPIETIAGSVKHEHRWRTTCHDAEWPTMKPLEAAARTGNVALVSMLLQRGASAKEQMSGVLAMAALSGSMAMLALFEERVRDANTWRIVFGAIQANSVEAVRWLHERGQFDWDGSVEIAANALKAEKATPAPARNRYDDDDDDDGGIPAPVVLPPLRKSSPLAFAAAQGRREIVALLLDSYALDVNEQSHGSRETALHAAAKNNQCDMIEFLLSRGAAPSLSIKSSLHFTPFMTAVHCSAVDAAVLLAAHERVSSATVTAPLKRRPRRNRGQGPLYRSAIHAAITRSDSVSRVVDAPGKAPRLVYSPDVRVLTALLDRVPELVNEPIPDIGSPLSVAFGRHRSDDEAEASVSPVVLLLLERGAHVLDAELRSALRCVNPLLMRTLVANVDLRNDNALLIELAKTSFGSWPTLHRDTAAIGRILVDRGAAPHRPDACGRTAAALAVAYDRPLLAAALLRGADDATVRNTLANAVRAVLLPRALSDDYFYDDDGTRPQIAAVLAACVDAAIVLDLDFRQILADKMHPWERHNASKPAPLGSAMARSIAMLLLVHRGGKHQSLDRIIPALQDSPYAAVHSTVQVDVATLVATSGASVVSIDDVAKHIDGDSYRTRSNVGRRRVVELALVLYAHFPPYVILEIFDWLPLSEFIQRGKKVAWIEGVVKSATAVKTKQ